MLSSTKPSHRFCVAPMMDWSDRHCRYFWRLISKKAWLYTEMVTTGALLQGDRDQFLRFNPNEHPVALQLGGSNPKHLAQCAQLAEQWAYDEVNFNCGCPSDRVQNGMIGACLMAHPQLVKDCLKAMQDATSIPVTIKHRIGIDDMDEHQGLVDFVGTVAESGCSTFIVHARKAWLQGLSPKENRTIPPLLYNHVYRLKQIFPQLTIVINGGICVLDECKEHLHQVDGVMIGREAYSNPYLLANVDKQLYQDGSTSPSRHDILADYMVYCDNQLAQGVRLHHMSKHILGLFQGVHGARAFRRIISENAHKPGADTRILQRALKQITD